MTPQILVSGVDCYGAISSGERKLRVLLCSMQLDCWMQNAAPVHYLTSWKTKLPSTKRSIASNRCWDSKISYSSTFTPGLTKINFLFETAKDLTNAKCEGNIYCMMLCFLLGSAMHRVDTMTMNSDLAATGWYVYVLCVCRRMYLSKVGK